MQNSSESGPAPRSIGLGGGVRTWRRAHFYFYASCISATSNAQKMQSIMYTVHAMYGKTMVKQKFATSSGSPLHSPPTRSLHSTTVYDTYARTRIELQLFINEQTLLLLLLLSSEAAGELLVWFSTHTFNHTHTGTDPEKMDLRFGRRRFESFTLHSFFHSANNTRHVLYLSILFCN